VTVSGNGVESRTAYFSTNSTMDAVYCGTWDPNDAAVGCDCSGFGDRTCCQRCSRGEKESAMSLLSMASVAVARDPRPNWISR